MISYKGQHCGRSMCRPQILTSLNYKRFNSTEHIAIECNSDESHMPGSFCMKVVQQGPRGFICELGRSVRIGTPNLSLRNAVIIFQETPVLKFL